MPFVLVRPRAFGRQQVGDGLNFRNRGLGQEMNDGSLTIITVPSEKLSRKVRTPTLGLTGHE